MMRSLVFGGASALLLATAVRAQSDSSADDSFPSVGIWAIVILVATLLSLLVQLVRHTCVQRACCVPQLGAALTHGAVASDCSSMGVRVTALVLASVALLLKAYAVFLDRWSFYSYSLGGVVLAEVKAGVLQSSLHYPTGLQDDTTTSYKELCEKETDVGMPDSQIAMCHTLRAAGILTLLVECASALVSVVLLLQVLLVLLNRQRLSAYVQRMWRSSSVAFQFACSTLSAWIAAHLVINYKPGGESDGPTYDLSTSYWLFVGATCIDLVLVFIYRRATVVTPPQQGLDGDFGLVTGGAAFMPLGAYAPGHTQQQQYAYAQQQQSQQQYAAQQQYQPPQQRNMGGNGGF